MPLMLLSNPGLSYAVLGNPRGRRYTGPKPKGVKRASFLRSLRRASTRVGTKGKTRGGKSTYRIDKFHGVLVRRQRRHLAGIPWSGRRGYLSFSGRVRRAGKHSYTRAHTFSNPRRLPMSRRRNPKALAGFLSAAKGAPKQILNVFSGPHKIRNTLYVAGGAAGTYLVGGLLSAKLVAPLLGRIPVVGPAVSSPMGSRVVGGMIPFVVGYIGSRFVKDDLRKALIVGGAVASITELLFPGKIGQLLARIPGVPAAASAAPSVTVPAIKGPTSGLDGYVSAPSYAGVGDETALAGYVSAPSYAGVGDDSALAGYVSAPSYAGVGDGDQMDDSVDGYIEDGQKNYESYLAN